MKKYIISMMSVTALLGAVTANAQPSAPTSFSGTGTVQKGTGTPLSCTISVSLSGSFATVAISPGDPGCATVILKNGPHPVTYHGPWESDFTVHDIFADTTITPGNCEGDLTAVLVAPGIWSINDSLNEVDPGTGHCTINGFVS